jgi:multidrug resistance protein, MATE family
MLYCETPLVYPNSPQDRETGAQVRLEAESVKPLLDSPKDEATSAALVGRTLRMALPNMLAFTAAYGINIITFGCLSVADDPLLLGAAGLGSLVGNIFGFSIGVGLTSVLDTLVSQAIGAGRIDEAIDQLNRARLLSVVVAVPCALIMLQTQWILALFHQDRHISALAYEFVLGTIWGLVPYFLTNALGSYMRCHNHTVCPLVINSVTCVSHFFICAYLVNTLQLGAYGAGVSISITCILRWVLSEFAMLIFEDTRLSMRGTDAAVLISGLPHYLSLAWSNSALLIIEWSAYELQALIAGWVGVEALVAHVAGANVVTCVFMGAVGIAQAASTLVGISLGESKPKTARKLATVALCFAASVYVVVGVLIAWNREAIASIISSDREVTNVMDSLLIVVGSFVLIDSLSAVSEGILRGMGLQHKAVLYKLAAMFGVRLPLGFILSHTSGVVGIWLGAVAGMLTSFAAFVYLILHADWSQCAARARGTHDREAVVESLKIPM